MGGKARRVRARLLISRVMIDLHAPHRRSSAYAALRCEGIRVATEVRRHGHPSGAAAAPAALRFGIGPNAVGAHAPGGDSKRPKVTQQIVSPIQQINARGRPAREKQGALMITRSSV